MAEAVKATKGRSKKSQGVAWQKITDKLNSLIKTRPDDHISSFLAELRELDISRKDPNAFYRTRDIVKGVGQGIMHQVGRTIEDKFYYADVVNQQYRPSPISAIRYLMNCVKPNTSAIIELGSGWSVNLFQVYVGLGQTRCKNIDFHGAEYTDEGQAAARRVADHDKAIRYHAHSFDYRKPDISWLKDYKGHILVFTRHSIEQVDIISPKLYDMLSELDCEVTLVHLEPTAWQRDPELIQRRKAKDHAYFEAIGDRLDEHLDDPHHQMENAAWWSWRLDYNINLTAIISANYRAKKIRVVRREFDFAGIGNVLNPSSLYHLEFIKPKAGAAVAAPASAPETKSRAKPKAGTRKQAKA